MKLAQNKRGNVELIRVEKIFGEVRAVNQVSLKIPSGSYCCLLGPSGCGKTATLRMIAGHESISSGQVLIDLVDVGHLPPASRGTAMMFQNYALFPHLNVLENVAFSLKMKGVNKATRISRASEILSRVQMLEFRRRQPSQLSGGQQQRVALARALITKPEVLLLDEPLSALDPFLRVRMREELKRLQTDLGITFIHVTHSQEEAMALSDLIVVMNDGKIEQVGDSRTIYNKPGSQFVARFIGGHNVIEGEKIIESGDKKIFQAINGAKFELPDLKMKKGGSCSIAIRSDHIKFSNSPLEAVNGSVNLKGRVSTVEYVGSSVRIGVDQEISEDFSVRCSEAVFFNQPLEVGDEVFFGWKKSDVEVLGLQ